MIKKIFEKLLGLLANKIVKKYQPLVVGITGSIGKTSTKEAVFSVLKRKYQVRRNIKNYNNEIGVPLTIIGAESGGRSVLKWLAVFYRALKLLMKDEKNYPKVLILEMGADKVGDIEYLVKIAPCHVGVLTKIGPTHLEAFKTIENIAKEKQKILTHLNLKDIAIFNYDDLLVRKSAKKTKARIISYGYELEAKVRAIDLAEQGSGDKFSGMKVKIQYEGSTVPIYLPRVVGAHQIYAALAAAAVGIGFGMNLVEISEGLKDYRAPRGRMNLIDGQKNTLIIDDTYNSSPQAAIAALNSLKELNFNLVQRKVAILGDMLELGDYTHEAHLELGATAVEAGISLLVGVGKFSHEIAEGAINKGFDSKNIFQFPNSAIAKDQILELVNDRDIILIKGSQGARMEKIVKELMQDKSQANDLLVRQGSDWLDN